MKTMYGRVNCDYTCCVCGYSVCNCLSKRDAVTIANGEDTGDSGNQTVGTGYEEGGEDHKRVSTLMVMPPGFDPPSQCMGGAYSSHSFVGVYENSPSEVCLAAWTIAERNAEPFTSDLRARVAELEAEVFRLRSKGPGWPV